MKKPHLLFSAVASLLLSVPALADSINFSLADANQAAASGSTLSYTATVAAPTSNGAPVFLNGDTFNLNAPLTLNDSGFFSNFPLSLAPGSNFTGILFTVTAPPNTDAGMYNGTFTLLGGANGAAINVLGTVNFAVNTPSAVPEPGTWLLLSTGLAGSFRLLKLRRNG